MKLRRTKNGRGKITNRSPKYLKFGIRLFKTNVCKLTKLMPVKIKEDIATLKMQVYFHAQGGQGVLLGNACHKLRCRYGFKYADCLALSGLMPAEFDELVSMWDEDDLTGQKEYGF